MLQDLLNLHCIIHKGDGLRFFLSAEWNEEVEDAVGFLVPGSNVCAPEGIPMQGRTRILWILSEFVTLE